MTLYEIFFGRKPHFLNLVAIDEIKTTKEKDPLNTNENKKYNQLIFNFLEQKVTAKNIINTARMAQDNEEKKENKFKNKNLIFL
jgi:predicted transcriptional regulator